MGEIRTETGSTLTRNLVLVYGLHAASYILSFITVPFLFLTLGADGFGQLALAQAICVYSGAVVSYAFEYTATQGVSRNRSSSEAVGKLCGTVYVAKLLLLLVVGSVLGVSTILFSEPSHSHFMRLVLLVHLGVVAQFLTPTWLFQGFERLDQLSVITLVSRILSALSLFLLVRTKDDLLLTAALQNLFPLIGGVIAQHFASRLVNYRSMRTSFGDAIAALRDGRRLFFVSSAVNTYGATNLLILGLVATTTVVGTFSSAHRVIQALSGLMAPLNQVLFPRIAAVSRFSEEKAEELVRATRRIISPIFAIVSLSLLLGGPILAAMIFAEHVEDIALLLQLMSPLPLIMALVHCQATLLLLAQGHKDSWTRLYLLAVILNFLGVAILFPLIRPDIALAIVYVVNEVWVVCASSAVYSSIRIRRTTVGTE